MKKKIEYEIYLKNNKVYINNLEIKANCGLPKFSEREIDIIKNRLYEKPTTFKALGEKYGVSRERIRQQYNNSLEKAKKKYLLYLKHKKK